MVRLCREVQHQSSLSSSFHRVLLQQSKLELILPNNVFNKLLKTRTKTTLKEVEGEEEEEGEGEDYERRGDIEVMLYARVASSSASSSSSSACSPLSSSQTNSKSKGHLSKKERQLLKKKNKQQKNNANNPSPPSSSSSSSSPILTNPFCVTIRQSNSNIIIDLNERDHKEEEEELMFEITFHSIQYIKTILDVLSKNSVW
eukprot:CAMPEP_0114356284 /NCGR_PEP_ID=MMETSP0101-20121206/20849_1 /TAXON_ID=38822 ORGANISM="Pteridomonas danica, Strain PT" /NCGR_SAMPLE_ID=MMETSP0101 /ASSEMBLY_ACC=CAM_ASM_000211 /LENGTH=200 /DNA_ID=CAMNT_0001498645 /DNA_START=437 /DNA_END=1036 /DNA_ORIENTATION=+